VGVYIVCDMALKYKTEKDLEPIFTNERGMSSFKLKTLLFRLKIKDEVCESCNLSRWLNRPMPLELHHIDGDPRNNALTNLQILCANCHSLEDSFCKKRSARMDLTLEEYKDAITNSTTLVEACAKLNMRGTGQSHYKLKRIMKVNEFSLLPKIPKEQIPKEQIPREKIYVPKDKKEYIPKTKIEWCSDEELAKIVWERSVAVLGKEWGITDTAIHHRCQRRKIPVPPPGYWRKYETGKYEECDEIKQETMKKYLV
jgi:hypothetical protein